MVRRWRKILKQDKLKYKKIGKLKQQEPKEPLSVNLNENEQLLRSIYANCFDVVFRSFWIGGRTKALLLYINGLSSIEEINENVLAPLMNEGANQTHSIEAVMEQKVTVGDIEEVYTFKDVIEKVSLGQPVILVNRKNTGFALGLEKSEKRSIEEPEAERVVKGPRDGFVETLMVNTSLIRRRIRSPKLKMETMSIGKYTQTETVLAYIDGLVDPTLVEEVKNRLKRIEIDSVQETQYIEDLIEDNPFSPFPQVLNTERVDVATSYLLEGHVAIIVNSTPFVLIAPTTFFSLMQSAEDYYQRFMISTLIRWLRYMFVVIALTLPSLYVAILTYHHEMVPKTLMITITATREVVPFPAIIEALIMEIIFEVLREAGIRLPQQVGPAISIVGGLIIGEAAVRAGIVSPPMVIVVATTGIASFAIPRYNAGIAIRKLRFPLLFLASILGLLGIMLGIIAIIVHLCSLRSFGVPYLTPIAPIKLRDMKDVMIRAPLWWLKTRPRLTGQYDKYRQGSDQKPDPNLGGERSSK